MNADQIGDEKWDRVCREAIGSWFWHTSAWRAYTTAYRPALDSRSLAFGVMDGGEPVALVPLMIEGLVGEDGCRLSFGGDPCWSPVLSTGLDASRRPAVLRTALEHVDAVAIERQAVSVSLRLSPLASGLDGYLPLFLAATTRAGYLDVSTTSQVIDLGAATDVLRRAMRKGHRADVTRGRRDLVTSVTSRNEAKADFDCYREMHALAAGRVTRPAQTFELMEAWLAAGTGALIKATKDGMPVGFTYLILHGDGAYYASAANHPDFGSYPIGHVLHAAAIEWLTMRGCRTYELGIQQFGPLPHDVPSDKEVRIAGFKRGFGGRTVPLVVRERWYSAEAYQRTISARTARYVSAAWPTAEGDQGAALPTI